MIQNALTAIIPILPGQLTALTNYLQLIGTDVENNPHVRFRQTPSTHFARWVILNDPSAPRLYFSACYDGTLQDYIGELTMNLGAGMEPIWLCCQGYPPRAAQDPVKFAEFLKPYCQEPDIFLIAFPGLSAQEIIRNQAFREQLDDHLDTLPRNPATPLTPVTVPVPPAKSIGTILMDLFWPLATWLINLLVGIRPGAPAQNTVVTTKNDLLAAEDKVVQNQMTIVSPVKKGIWPGLLLRFFLWLGSKTDKPAPDGKLSGLSTIHFARWVRIDDGKNLLFESNYDGSWENYIDDFGDHAATAMNAVWGISVGFPKGGCLDIEAFKDGIRRYQHPAQFFYSAYPTQTVRNIATDRRLRQNPDSASFKSGALG
ncbi:MAG TPA: hypothetical protein VG347_16685 [Verrucomicrobiae bacterium]|nr:hypothetical protein [Verrucomicrobiae bacterium]